LGTEGTEAPEFQVKFSRPADFASRPESRPNSFRWSGSGTIHLMERGVLIIARRRSALAFHTTEQRFVPAAEIWDVYREGNSVRVDLRAASQQRDYFQFWTADAATAGTIVRLLPTTRTIEYDGHSAIPVPSSQTPSSYRRTVPAHTFIPAALVIGFIVAASLFTAGKLRHHSEANQQQLTAPVAQPAAGASSLSTQSTAAPQISQRRATAAQVEAVRAVLKRFDDRIDGLRVQYRMAFGALQAGTLSQPDFITGVDRWLLPQWRALYGELASNAREDGSLDSLVRNQLMQAARGWQGALDEYVRGLRDQSSVTVMDSFDRMSAANQSQRAAWDIIERAEP